MTTEEFLCPSPDRGPADRTQRSSTRSKTADSPRGPRIRCRIDRHLQTQPRNLLQSVIQLLTVILGERPFSFPGRRFVAIPWNDLCRHRKTQGLVQTKAG